MANRIYLSGKKGAGQYTLVDDCDYEKLNKYKWRLSKKGYAETSINFNDKWKSIFIHSLIMKKEIIENPNIKIQVDHKNQVKLDNRKNNLRLCTNSENCRNVKKYKNKVCNSKYKGVSERKDRNKKWAASIRYNGKLIYLNSFYNEEKAAKCYDNAAKKYFKEFASLNFKES